MREWAHSHGVQWSVRCHHPDGASLIPTQAQEKQAYPTPQVLGRGPQALCRVPPDFRAEGGGGYWLSQLLIKAVSSPSALSPSPSPRTQLHLMSPPTQQLVFLQVEERDEPLTTV